MYFRPESVRLAIDMLDETDFRLGQKAVTGPMRVSEADSSYKNQKDHPLATESAKLRGTGANRDRQKIIKKNQEMNRYALVQATLSTSIDLHSQPPRRLG